MPIFESSLLGESHNVLSVETGTQTEFSFVHRAFYMEPDQTEVNICLDHAYSCVTLTKNVLVNACVLQEEMSKKIKLLSDEISALKEQINAINLEFEEFKSRHFSLDRIKNDPSAVKFYTGFPNYESLISVFKYFEPKFQRVHYWTGPKTFETIKEQLQYQSADMFRSKPGSKRSLSLLEEFFIVLLRLKVVLFLGDIADRYHISSGHVSKIFTTWINFLYHELPLLFPFPSQANVRKYMPNQFKEYPTTRIIIDGTELTKKSGILNLFDDGDNIMADRGFDIADILPESVALNIPPFKGLRDQLTAEESEETARIAAVRIHVERAIGRVKCYHILNGVIPLSLSPLINQMFTVCSYLTNILPPLCSPPEDKNE